MSLSATLSSNPSVLHSLVDSFFEAKKAQVKERLMDSVKLIVDDLFVEMVGQVKEMLLPPKEVSPSLEQTFKKEVPSTGNSSSFKPQVKKVNNNSAKQTSTANKPTPKILTVKNTTGQKRTAESANLATDSSSKVVSSKDNKSDQAKKMKMSVQFEDNTVFDDFVNVVNDFEDGPGEVFDDEGNFIEQEDDTFQLANYYHNDDGDEKANLDFEETVEVSGKFVCNEPGCGKSFRDNFLLKRHSLKHSGVKPFACSFPNCTFDSNQRSNTLRHIRTVHLKNLKLEEGQTPPEPEVYLNVKQELL